MRSRIILDVTPEIIQEQAAQSGSFKKIGKILIKFATQSIKMLITPFFVCMLRKHYVISATLKKFSFMILSYAILL